MTTRSTGLGSQATVNLADIRRNWSQSRSRFTQTRGAPRITPDNALAPDFITLISLISEIYRQYGDEMEPVRQFHRHKEIQYTKGHTSSVSHTRISRHVVSAVSSNPIITKWENIIVKRPRERILEPETYALVSFITELRVRTHAPLREHPNIGQLRGVAWDFEDEEATIPRPLFLEELAPQGTLDKFWVNWDFVRLKFKSKLDLARDIAEGLRVMHRCGVVHGDVKPENILILPRVNKDNEFLAKLTDFGHSVFEHSDSKSLPAFTPQWCAPELLPERSGPKTMGFCEMKLTDTYSYGLVVLSIMIDHPFYESIGDSTTLRSSGSILSEAIELVRREDREKHDSDLDLATVDLLMRQAIRLRPKRRNLDECIRIINQYDSDDMPRGQRSHSEKTSHTQVIKDLDVKEMVAIGYSSFSQTSHHLKSRIVESLSLIANDGNDPRRWAAAWELSICYFSGFGVAVSHDKCSKWLSIASEGGVAAALDYFTSLHEAMKRPYQMPLRRVKERQSPTITTPNRRSSSQVREPESKRSRGTFSDGSETESDTDDKLWPPVKLMPDELLNILNSGTLQDLQGYLKSNPINMNCQDNGGNTPLILAARRQQVNMLEFIVEQEDINAGIWNRSGHTVLHFLPLLDDETVQNLVPKLVERRADLHHEALTIHLTPEDTILTSEIRSCAILNAILYGNMTLLKCLLDACHSQATSGLCHICEGGTQFRRIFAVALSIFQARALTMLVAHVRDHRNQQDIGLKDMKVWAGNKLLPLHVVPFNSVVIGALDLPDLLFRAMKYGKYYTEALENTILLLLSTEDHVENLAYSMMCAAVEGNNLEAVKFLLNEGDKRRFAKLWWVRGPLDTSPFMRSVSLGFREILQSFLEHTPNLLKGLLTVPCWIDGCQDHYNRWWDQPLSLFRPRRLPPVKREHDLNPVQMALLILCSSSHQDNFFTNAILDAAEPTLVTRNEEIIALLPSTVGTPAVKDVWLRGETSDSQYRKIYGCYFLERAILSSMFTPAATIIKRFPDLFRTGKSWHYVRNSNVHNTSIVLVKAVLHYGTYRQCRFVMEHLLPLRRASRTSSSPNSILFCSRASNSEEDGVQEWTRCPLSREEYDRLVWGNIRSIRNDRKDLWNIIETQAGLGHYRPVSYLRDAIQLGNTEALREMLRRGWNPNSLLWDQMETPLQYTKRLQEKREGDIDLYPWTLRQPHLPQTDWEGSRTHAAVYEAYKKQSGVHVSSNWNAHLKLSQAILREHGRKTLPLKGVFTKWVTKILRNWLKITLFVFILPLPLIFTYRTEHKWTSMSTGQKLAFSYLWSLLVLWDLLIISRNIPTTFEQWIPNVLVISIDFVVLPILVIQVNWSPFLSCRDIYANTETTATACNVATECTNYTFLLPLVAVTIGAIYSAYYRHERRHMLPRMVTRVRTVRLLL
ncbi:hypothetical protein F5B22DRAFT_652647 [Xylaria bambusicola]|uniref:uncharacterized protein n=1 Tax=Xylaria bambusicola TaxID=326684 RepID=UPI0020085AB4|nr:uncharacterized protein F5B22DRAFT_652647 [Xylaria bambusicola]KAI0502867.1 hypothetical protein F5B22DRAFT_652647 [Xylaria bambusicola]